MGLNLVFIGFLFFVNPNVNIIDVVPDFIGIALIWVALSRLRDMSSDIEACRKRLAVLFFTELAKLLCAVVTLSGRLDSGFILLFSFSFTVIELLLYIPMLLSLFGGMMYLSTGYNGDASVSALGKAKNATVAFFIAREVLTFLPQLSYLYIEEGVGYVLEPYMGVVLVLSGFFQVVAAVFWIIRLFAYRGALRRDREFIVNMESFYDKSIRSDTGRFTARRLKNGLVFIIFFVLLSVPLYFDGKLLFPTALGALCAAGALICFGRHTKGSLAPSLIAAAVFCASEVAMYVYGGVFAGKYYFLGISESVEAFQMFERFTVISATAGVLQLVLCAIIFLRLISVIKGHTGVDYKNELPSVVAREREYKRGLIRLSRVWLFVSAIGCASGVADAVCLYVWQPYWMIDIIIRVIWISLTMKLYYSVSERIEARYL